MMGWRLRFRNCLVVIGLICFGLNSKGQDTLSFGNVQVGSPTLKKVNVIPGTISNASWKVVTYNSKYSNFESVDSVIDDPYSTHEISIRSNPNHNMNQNGICYLYHGLEGVYRYWILKGQAEFSNIYYASTQNKEGEALKTALKSTISSGYKSLGYTAARDAMYSSIDNSGGQVECVYTGKMATFNSRAGANSAGFNCEHTFPQGFFSSNEPMKSDIHHLFPTTTTSNSQRGNDPFGLVSNPSWNDGGSKSGGGKFEPRDKHKGTVARSMLYFGLRYQDYSNFLAGQENVLRSWAVNHPPSPQDIDRNNAISNVQKNRNPFVDYPQLLERISSISSTATISTKKSYQLSNDAPSTYLDTVPGYGENRAELLINDGHSTLTFSAIVKGTYRSDTIVYNKSLKANEAYLLPFKVAAHRNSFFVEDTLFILSDVPGSEYREFRYSAHAHHPGSVSERDVKLDFKISPNPVSENIQLQLDGQNEYDYRVISTSGAVVQLGEVDNNQINVSSLVDGNYLLELTNQKGEKGLEKFMIYH